MYRPDVLNYSSNIKDRSETTKQVNETKLNAQNMLMIRVDNL